MVTKTPADATSAHKSSPRLDFLPVLLGFWALDVTRNPSKRPLQLIWRKMSQTERFCNQNEHVLRDLPELGFQGAPEGPRKVNTALFPVWRGEKFPQAHTSKQNKLTQTNPSPKCYVITGVHLSTLWNFCSSLVYKSLKVGMKAVSWPEIVHGRDVYTCLYMFRHVSMTVQ